MTENKDTRVNDILDAALAEFVEKGFERASMESIAQRAQLSKGGLYHHFKSKSEILFMVNLKLMEPIQGLLQKMEPNSSVAIGLCQFISDYLNFWNAHKQELTLYFITMNISFNDPAIMGYYKESANYMFTTLEQLFLGGQTDGIFIKHDAHSHAVAMISCLDGFLAYMLIEPSIELNRISLEIQETFINRLLVK